MNALAKEHRLKGVNEPDHQHRLIFMQIKNLLNLKHTFTN